MGIRFGRCSWFILAVLFTARAVPALGGVQGSDQDPSPGVPKAAAQSSPSLPLAKKAQETSKGKSPSYRRATPRFPIPPDPQRGFVSPTRGESPEEGRQEEGGKPNALSNPSVHPFRERTSDENLFLEAKALCERNRLHEANEYLKSLLEDHPQSRYCPDTFSLLGKNYLELSKFREAASCFEVLLARYPHFVKAKEALVHLGVSLEGIGDLGRARSVFDRYRSLVKDFQGLSASALLSMARTYARSGDREGFLKAAFHGLNLSRDPSLKEEFFHLIARFYRQGGRIDAAIRVLAGLGLERPGTRERVNGLIPFADLWREHPQVEFVPYTLMAQGFLSPKEIYLWVSKNHPDREVSRQALFKAGQILFEEGDDLGAIRTLIPLLDSTSGGPFLIQLQLRIGQSIARFAEAQGSKGKFFEVASLYAEELEGRENLVLDSKALFWIAESFRHLGLRESALPLYRRALESRSIPDLSDRVLSRLCEAYREGGRWRECIDTLLPPKGEREALVREPRLLEILGEALVRTGEQGRAVSVLSRHGERLTPVGRFWLAQAFHRTGPSKEAERFYREALSGLREDLSSEQKGIAGQARLHLADLLLSEGRGEEAKRIYQEVLTRGYPVQLSLWANFRMAQLNPLPMGSARSESPAGKGPSEGGIDPLWASAISAMRKIASIPKEEGILSR